MDLIRNLLNPNVVRNLNDKPKLDQNQIAIILLPLIITLGSALRLYDLGGESYWIDEVSMVYRTKLNLEPFIHWERGRFSVYIILAHFWMQSFGPSEVATRSFSAVASIAAIPLMYLVGRELFGRRAGLISALLMAISGIQIFHAQNYRYYSLVVLMTLLSYFFYIRALRSGKFSHFGLYVIASILLFFTHTTTVFVLTAQGLYFLIQWQKYKVLTGRWILAQTLILIALGPFLLQVFFPDFLEVMEGPVDEGLFTPTMHLKDPAPWLPLHTLGRYLFFYPGWTTAVSAALFFLVATFLLAFRQGKTGWLASIGRLGRIWPSLSSRRSHLLLIGLWLLCPIILLFSLSKILGPLYHERYTIGASPAFYLLLAFAITAVRKVVPELISVATLVIMIVPGLQDYYVSNIKEQWRETAAYVAENARPGDVLVFEPDLDGRWRQVPQAFYWYYQGDLPECQLDLQFKSDEALVAELTRCTADYERIWLVVWGTWPGRLEVYFFNPDREAVHLIREQKFVGTSVYLFEPNSETISAISTQLDD